ncbi:EF-hand domain-containing protein [Actinocatenispora rupis]|uniref:Calcium-binding protein n=1 Tax=Actinocatenispora rupis TaxID=519421 RepID=A0A8J3N959_9ACTN|nr:EF-hand domain-containing protein [Actinocatenispora rupis]GID11014.1 calcium-binding protein [Actinocatenispora rupis]
MATVVQEQRLQERFDLWDVNGDGTIDKSDWEAEARRILRGFGEPEDSPKATKLMNAYLGMWDYLANKAGVGNNGSMTPDQFRQVADRHILADDGAGFAKVLQPTINAILKLADTDGDGAVSPQEFRRWIQAVGADPSVADEAFRRIDTDGNGELSVQELVQAVKDYHLGRLEFSLLGR